MTLTFESDKDVIVYALKQIISYARNNQYLFLAQSVWWISSIIGLQQDSVIHIDNLKISRDLGTVIPSVSPFVEQEPLDTTKVKIPEVEDINRHIHPSRLAAIQGNNSNYSDSENESISTTEADIHTEVIDYCEAFFEQSKQERNNLGRITRKASRVIKRKPDKKKPIKTFRTETEGIDGNEL
jgi:hypothetical protein